MSRFLLTIWALWCFASICFAQNITITGESPNYYLKADQVFANSIRITETLPGQLIQFEPGAKVLVIQMTGVTLDSTTANFKTTLSRTKKSMGKTGTFEILQVDEVIMGADTLIYFTDNLSNTYDNNEKIQLVKLVEGETVTVTGILRPKPWDGRVGGILGIIAIDSVKLANNSIIDVSARGFRGGAVPVEIYQDGLCRFTSGNQPWQHDTMHFRSNSLGRSGNKGEGVITTQWPFTKGTGFNINGGGAGNGLYSGGGGGSNFSAGGDGGIQSSFCIAASPVIGGIGGYGCGELYDNGLKPKAILGGGGGSGTYRSGSTPSRGGNGGGMVMIITGTLVTGTATSIRANGEHAFPTSTTGSGAGGGGGGSVFIDAANFAGTPMQIQIKGGNGSSTTSGAPNCTGVGGGGSGGFFWHSGITFPASIIDNSSGTPGTPSVGCFDQVGYAGAEGGTLTNLVVPLTGFLFNTIRATDTAICEGQVPDLINASQPKGGNGIYTISWQQSTDNLTWSDADGIKTTRTLSPVALTQTTYYRRTVSSVNPVTLAAINDVSRVYKIFVYPAIANNNVLGTDTICFNVDAKPLQGIATPLSGGNGIYSYTWQESTDHEQWSDCGIAPAFDPDELSVTTYFRRIISSAKYCSDTSSSAIVTVLDNINDNDFVTIDTSICENSGPGRLRITLPTGGDDNYTYQWQYRNTGGWSNIAQTIDSAMYTAGILSDTTSYRRIVYSGNDRACIDTSNVKNIIIRPLITNNNILGPDIKYTCFDSPVTLLGSDPANGFGSGSYSYAWEESDNSVDWQNVSANTKDYQSADLSAKRYFRRIVYSTPQLHECSNISDPVEIRINPLPTANVVNMSDTLCAGSALFVKFNVAGNGPFEVTVQGEDAPPVTKSGITGALDSVLFTPNTEQQFRIVRIEDDSSCLGDPQGFVPVTAGKIYAVPEADAGVDNSICANSYTLQAVKSDIGFKGLWTASGAAFENDTLANSIVTVDNFGPNIFTWTETNWHCTDNDDVEITFYEQPAVPEAGPDQELNFIFQCGLNGSIPSVGAGKWMIVSGAGSFDDDTRPDAFITDLTDEAKLRWTISNGSCPEVSDSMSILIKPLVIPKAFTPDGNNKHDVFEIGATHAEKISVKIFNSAGILVFESDDYTDADELWTGESKDGIQLPEGTYFYIINIKVAGKTDEVQFRSFVEIMR